MSDIYLQIAETPTVVTLSAPVISGALSSTVTVANTVTVALDSNSLSALENVTVTVGAAITGTVTVGNSVTISSLPAISGTVNVDSLETIVEAAINNVSDFPNSRLATAIYEGNGETSPERFIGVGYTDSNGDGKIVSDSTPFPVRLLSTINVQAMAGTARIGVVTIGAGTVTIGAGTAQIGSVTASISNFPATQAVSLTTLPALVAGTAQIGSVTASISNTVTASISGTVPISISSVTVGNSVTIGSIPAISGTVTANIAISSSAITSGSFSSLTSATLVPGNTARKMATVYNLGAGQLYINAGATATTLGGGFMVALSSGDFYECDYTTTTLSAIFATAGTASWVSH